MVRSCSSRRPECASRLAGQPPALSRALPQVLEHGARGVRLVGQPVFAVREGTPERPPQPTQLGDARVELDESGPQYRLNLPALRQPTRAIGTS